MKKIFTILFGIALVYSCSTSTDDKGNSVTTVIPLSPTNLVGTIVSTTQLNLSWTDNSTNETGFKIERKTGAGIYAIVGTTLPDISTFSDNGLLPNTTYTYRVYSYNSVGNSLTYSNELTLTTSSLIVLPTLTTTVVTSTIGGNALSGGNITNSGNAVITARGVVWSVSTNPTISLSTKTVDGSGNGMFESTITGLVSGTTYFARAYATNSAGTSYGNEITFTETAVPLNGLVGYWPFNGNANDVSGNGNNGTVNGATLTTDRFGNTNNSYSFIKSNILVPNNFFDNGWLNYSVSLWFLIYDKTFQNQSIFHTSLHNGEGFDYNHSTSSNKISYWKNSSTSIGAWDIFSNNMLVYNPINNQTWYNLTLVKQGNNYSYYINGQLDKTSVASKSALNQIIGVSFGYSGATSEYLNGKLDNIGIWNRTLTQAEVVAIYNSTN